MLPKQQEMDDIIKEIYTAMLHQKHLQSTLLVLCGDHGMNDAGNHGGSSPGETSPALTFISQKFLSMQSRVSQTVEPEKDFQYYRTVPQSDIVPTLAGLLGFPVPLNNLGVFIREFLQLWEQGKQNA
jgi:ethanolaminephosphotransferase